MKRHHRMVIAVAFGLTAFTTVGATTAFASPDPPTLSYCNGVKYGHEKTTLHAPNGTPAVLDALFHACVA